MVDESLLRDVDVVDDATLRIMLLGEPAPLPGMLRDETGWVLGRVKIYEHHPIFRVRQGGVLTAESRFRKQQFDFADAAKRGWAVIFRRFDPERPHDRPAEFFAGWVPLERELEVDRWIAFLNLEIQSRLSPAS